MAGGQQPPVGPGQPAESPMMGLFTDRPAHMIDPKGFSACNNVRIELGRVRTDGIGWLSTGIPDLGTGLGGVFHMDQFSSLIFGSAQTFAYAGIDMYLVGDGGANYATPCYNMGTVSVANNSTTVTGVSTRWNSNYAYGSTSSPDTTTCSAASAGATTLTLAANGFWTCGQLVSIGGPTNNTTYLPNGTFITGTSGATITLSNPVTTAIPGSTTVVIGTNSALRNNVRVGDYITFGNTAPGAVTGPGALVWFQIASVASDTSLTLTAPFPGATLSGSTYCIRQCFHNPSPFGSTAFIGNCSSDTYLAAAGWNGALTNAQGAAIASNGQCDAWYFSNGVDPVYAYYVTYTTTSVGVYVPTIPYFVQALKQKSGIMVYGGLNGFLNGNANAAFSLPTEIASSDDGFPVQLNTGVSFQGIATSGPFPITKLGILGANLMIYGTGSKGGAGAKNPDTYSGVVTSASFVDYPTIWSFSDVVQTRGPVSGGAVAVFSDRHQFLAIDGEYRYNGLFIQVMNDHVWREVMKNFDYSRAPACFCLQADKYGDLIWAVPLTTDASAASAGPAQTAFVEHYMEQANSYLFKPFTQRDFPFVTGCAIVGQGFASQNLDNPIYVVGDQNGNIWQLYVSNSQGGTPPLCTVTWATRRITDPTRQRPLVTRVYPEIEYMASPAGNINVTLTLQDAVGGPVIVTDTQTFNPSYPNQDIYFTNHFRRGRLASVTLSDQASIGWVCDGYDWDVVKGGKR